MKVPALHELAEAPWHKAHENAVSGLAKRKDPRGRLLDSAWEARKPGRMESGFFPIDRA